MESGFRSSYKAWDLWRGGAVRGIENGTALGIMLRAAPRSLVLSRDGLILTTGHGRTYPGPGEARPLRLLSSSSKGERKLKSYQSDRTTIARSGPRSKPAARSGDGS